MHLPLPVGLAVETRDGGDDEYVLLLLSDWLYSVLMDASFSFVAGLAAETRDERLDGCVLLSLSDWLQKLGKKA